jgi:hypothetical protein
MLEGILMKRLIIVLGACLLDPSLAVGGQSEDDLKRFDRFATYDFKTTECDDDDKGRYQYSCRNIETGDISGYIQPAKLEKSQTGIFLGKYWGTGDRLKFIGIACGRGDTEEEAKKAATFRAHEIVRRAVEGLETNVLTGEFKPLAYRKDEERFICVLTDRNHKDKSLVEAENAAADAEREREAREEDERQARESAERLQRQREERRLVEERERQSTTLVVEVQSLDTYAVELSFYSQTYRNRAWPGGDQVYILSDSDVHSYRLNCRKGEKICYGAWRRGNRNSWWGAGYGAQQGCSDCCLTCGGSYKYTLNAGSNSPQASNQSAVDALTNILGGVAAGIGAANSMRAPSTPTFRPSPPPAQGANRRSSTITGGSH